MKYHQLWKAERLHDESALLMFSFWFNVPGYARNHKQHGAFYSWIRAKTEGVWGAKLPVARNPLFFFHYKMGISVTFVGKESHKANCFISENLFHFCTNTAVLLLCLKNKRWHSFRSILLYVLAHICFPSLLLSSNQFLVELLHYSMETA